MRLNIGIARNHMEAIGAKIIARALQFNNTLKILSNIHQLDISKNEIGDEGMLSIAQSLQVNQTVAEIGNTCKLRCFS